MASEKHRICLEHAGHLKKFKEWIMEDPKMPKNIDDLLLLRFIKVADFNLEEAKRLLILNFEMRAKFPKVFIERSWQSNEMKIALNTSRILHYLPNVTKENYKITLTRLNDGDAKNFVIDNLVKITAAVIDARALCSDPLVNGHIIICDVSLTSFKHLVKVASSLRPIRHYIQYLEEASVAKVVQIHFVNVSSIFEKILTVLKKVMSKKVAEMINIHTSLNSLYEHVPRDFLPIEYGGDAGYFEELYEKHFKEIEENFEHVADESKWKFIENL